VYNEWIDGENKPTRACVQAELARPALLVEVQVTAALP
jgi:enamine deaminase RidA (YjgF/YER057c/UK114 family)